MSSRFFLDSNNVLRVYDYGGTVAIPSGHTAVLRSVIEAAYDGDVYLGGTWDGTTYTPPAGQSAAPSEQDVDLRQLHDAYVAYHTLVRKQGWLSLADGRADALKATDRWVYHQIALGDRIARGEWMASRTQAERDAALVQLVAWVRNQGYVWYGVMAANSVLATSWSGAAMSGGSIIYTDLLVATGDAAGDVRTPDGGFHAVLTTIHADFDPELPTLRS